MEERGDVGGGGDAGSFFSAEALTEGAVELGEGFDAVPCAGASNEEQEYDYHPKIVRGQVMAPTGRLAMRDGGFFPNWLVPAAHAVPLELEQPVGNARVLVYTVNSRGMRLGPAAVTTETDPLGRYCVRIPDHLDFGPRLMAEVAGEDERLRRFLPNNLDGNISIQTEVLVRLVLDRVRRLDEVSTAELLNLHTVADTTMDLLNPAKLTPVDDIESAAEKVRENLLADNRFTALLEGLD